MYSCHEGWGGVTCSMPRSPGCYARAGIEILQTVPDTRKRTTERETGRGTTALPSRTTRLRATPRATPPRSHERASAQTKRLRSIGCLSSLVLSADRSDAATGAIASHPYMVNIKHCTGAALRIPWAASY